MDVTEWKSLLNKSTLFSSLTEAEIARVLDNSQDRHFNKAEIILREGEISDQVFLIGKGSVTIALSGSYHNKLPIETLGAGNFFGEMACMEHKPRMANVVAELDCDLLVIAATLFHDLVEKNASFASKFSLILSSRLRKLTEEILSVRVNNVDEKLALSNTKLDASLKAMDSQMKAAQTIFEQTSSRASEVIQSFDRTRTQVILAGTVVSLLASVLLGLFAFFGWQEWKNITQPIQQKVATINATADKIQQLHDKIEVQSRDAAKIQNLLADLTDLKTVVTSARQAQLTLYSVIIKTNFESIVLEDREDLYQEFLKVADPDLTEEIFIQILKGLMNSEEVYRTPYITLLRNGLNRGYTLTSKQKALSYYYLIAARLLTDDERGYVALHKEFDRFMSNLEAPVEIIQDLGPNWFTEYLDAISVSSDNQLKIDRLNRVWNKMTGQNQ